jgi:hypothetical protein
MNDYQQSNYQYKAIPPSNIPVVPDQEGGIYYRFLPSANQRNKKSPIKGIPAPNRQFDANCRRLAHSVVDNIEGVSIDRDWADRVPVETGI